jgi:serine protease Do
MTFAGQKHSFRFPRRIRRLILACLLLILLATTLNAANRPDFIDIVAQNMPSVVTITVKKKVPNNSDSENLPKISQNSEDSELKDFFGRFFENTGKTRRLKAIGTGLIVSSEGEIVTVAHLVKNATKIWVSIDGKKQYKAKVIATDKSSDIALLKIKASGLQVPTFGDPNKLKVGEWVLSIGAPFGFEKSASQGIISARGRKLPTNKKIGYLQTDVAVNPGNSGGPLINTDGEVIGINSQIYSKSGGYQGVSFAIPIFDVLEALKRVR